MVHARVRAFPLDMHTSHNLLSISAIYTLSLAHSLNPTQTPNLNRYPTPNRNPNLLAAMKDYIEVVKLLIACEADTNAMDANGWTPMMWGACLRACVRACVRTLPNVDLQTSHPSACRRPHHPHLDLLTFSSSSAPPNPHSSTYHKHQRMATRLWLSCWPTTTPTSTLPPRTALPA